MKNLATHINESLQVNEAKYSGAIDDDTLVKKAIQYIKSYDVKDITDLSNEAKGYSFKVKGKSGHLTISYDDVNDVLNNHKQEQAKAKREIQNTNQIVTQEVIKYVKDSNAANDAIDDEFVRVYNQSLPN